MNPTYTPTHNLNKSNRITFFVCAVLFFVAFIIPVIVFSVVFYRYNQQSWNQGQCIVKSIVPTLDEFVVCRTLFKVELSTSAGTQDALACTSVNARQSWNGDGGGKHKQIDVCSNIDDQPWTDGPLIPAAWKCTQADKYKTADVWTLPYNSTCAYYCNDDNSDCVAIMDSAAPYMDWYHFHLFLVCMSFFGMAPVVLCLTASCVFTEDAFYKWGWRVVMCCGIPILGWTVTMMKGDVAVVFAIFCGCWLLLGMALIVTSNPRVSMFAKWVQVLVSLALGVCSAVMSSSNILYLVATLYLFVYSFLMPVFVLYGPEPYHQFSSNSASFY